MKIKFEVKGKNYEMELEEALDKILCNGKNEIKKSINYTPDYLAEVILTNENITSEMINLRFENSTRAVKYTLLKYCFDLLSEENRYRGIFELDVHKYQCGEHIMSKEKLIEIIGEENYNKYNQAHKYYQEFDFTKSKREDFTEKEFEFIQFMYKVASIEPRYQSERFMKYLKFMIHFGLKIKTISYGSIIYAISDKENHEIINEYMKTWTTKQKKTLYDKACTDNYRQYGRNYTNMFINHIINFANEYNIEDIKNYVKLDNM